MTVNFWFRQVLEETGFDMRGYVQDDQYVEYKMNETQCRLYVVRNVSMETKFVPRTRKEIKVFKYVLFADNRIDICV